ncbi:MAG TPA: serine--tRNA ligase [Dehalococcoidia bacterium]|nr:serine--tRNA ligase [Dehalococcoidia bacterium]|tara:strand:+ start:4561 stop:5874 length:1314 start_codon:yes stop_codon:yes gene_type:complete
MINPELLRRNPESIKLSLSRRNEEVSIVDELIGIDIQRRKIISEIENFRSARNELSKKIAELIKSGNVAEANKLKDEVRQSGEELKAQEEKLRASEETFRYQMLRLPNLVSEEVPDGLDFTSNIVLWQEGERRKYEFDLKPHWELSESLDITDFERGSKVSGRMFYVLGETGARLQRALVSYMIDLHRETHGYLERSVPFLVLGKTMENSSNLPKFADALYRDAEEDLWLIPTAEVPLTSLHADEILNIADLPIKYMAHTPCFRREKAAAGTQVRGLKRVHQFEKVEMYQFVEPESSMDALEELIQHASDVVRGLGLPFRLLQLCAGDLSFPSVKSFDIEIYSPASDEWLEVSSCSNCTDFQSRRANIRFRRDQAQRPELVHTLNGSGLAIPRVIIAILETFQQPDGSVVVPNALVQYLGGQEVLEPLNKSMNSFGR